MARELRLVPPLALLLAWTIACARSPVQPGSPASISTIVVATMRAITPVASPTLLLPPSAVLPTTMPPPATIPTAAIATRVSFPADATSGVLRGAIEPGAIQSFIVQAAQGQPMRVWVDSPSRDVTLSIQTQGGTSLLSAASFHTSWRGTLPQTEDYIVSVHGGTSEEDFALTIEIVARIKFKEGAVAATVSGATVAGSTVAYAVFGEKGQKMDASLSGAGKGAALGVFGFVDNQTFLGSVAGRTSFRLELPSTQDYIVEVVPIAGRTVDFLLTVQIQ